MSEKRRRLKNAVNGEKTKETRCGRQEGRKPSSAVIVKKKIGKMLGAASDEKKIRMTTSDTKSSVIGTMIMTNGSVTGTATMMIAVAKGGRKR